jgi:hypothetical protein
MMYTEKIISTKCPAEHHIMAEASYFHLHEISDHPMYEASRGF